MRTLPPADEQRGFDGCQTEAQLNALITRAVAGEASAQSTLLSIVRGWLLRLADKSGLSGADAEEVVGEVLPEVWFRLEEFDPNRGGFHSWVYSRGLDGVRAVYALRGAVSVPRRARAVARDAGNVVIVSIDADRNDGSKLIEIPDQGHEGHADIERGELRAIVAAVLGGLSSPHRDVVLLRFGLDGGAPMTVQQIAKRCGVTHQAISLRLAAALKTLKQTPKIAEMIGC